MQIDTNATKRFCGMLKGLLKAVKIIQTFEGKPNHSNDEKNSYGRKQLQ